MYLGGDTAYTCLTLWKCWQICVFENVSSHITNSSVLELLARTSGVGVCFFDPITDRGSVLVSFIVMVPMWHVNCLLVAWAVLPAYWFSPFLWKRCLDWLNSSEGCVSQKYLLLCPWLMLPLNMADRQDMLVFLCLYLLLCPQRWL